MNGPKFAKRNVGPDRLRVLGVVLSRLVTGAIGIAFALAAERSFEHLSGGRYHYPIQTSHGDCIAGLYYPVRGVGIKRGVGLLQKLVGRWCGLYVRSMVDELFDGNELCEFRQSAKMIPMPVGDYEVIDPGDAGVLRGSHNAPGVSK